MLLSCKVHTSPAGNNFFKILFLGLALISSLTESFRSIAPVSLAVRCQRKHSTRSSRLFAVPKAARRQDDSKNPPKVSSSSSSSSDPAVRSKGKASINDTDMKSSDQLDITTLEPLKGPELMPAPLPNSIGNFFEDRNNEGMSFIQCFMLSIGRIDGAQYGVGFPVDMPVMLTYFEENELKPVRPDYPDYDHLINHVAVQMDFNDFQLYKTPVVLTLQGEFEDKELNDIVPGLSGLDDDDDDEEEDYEDDEEEEEEEDEEEDDDDDDEGYEEITVEEVIRLEGLDLEEDSDEEFPEDYDEEEDEDEEEDDKSNRRQKMLKGDEDEEFDVNDDNGSDVNVNMDSFWSSSPAGRIDPKYQAMPDYNIVPQTDKASPDMSNIPEDAVVSEEDTKRLRKAHKRADKIIEYASDVSLIASFHYKKKNFHLVKLLEPIFIIGKRMEDIKGYYFTLLDDQEGAKVVPILEELLTKQPPQQISGSARGKAKANRANAGDSAKADAKIRGNSETDEPGGNNDGDYSSSGRGPGTVGNVRKSRRRWTTRKKD